ncbi:hypothetical protein TRFO_05025 [Tritrichomonas foetus]|uniref:Uncharacterized protein n=1 Tax=Tritrichomonas foetus TaxID=1144522 RepID=A0A1J4K9K4_9EUKA|nr:hypothetical protein TRFO_05025 [Tritrichomonas foetus]|eukprot:OHT07915.1 hypothetical protein TRFO_05025 [Tritrichomonas foetus]
MSLTAEDLKRIQKLNKEISSLKDDFEKVDNKTSAVTNEILDLRKDVYEAQEKSKQPLKKSDVLPKHDRDLINDGKSPRYVLQPNDPLFREPPTPQQKYRTGRVKYVTDKSEMVSWPRPGELSRPGKTMVATTLFIDFRKNKFSSLTQGNMEFAPVNVKVDERPSMAKFLQNK